MKIQDYIGISVFVGIFIFAIAMIIYMPSQQSELDHQRIIWAERYTKIWAANNNVKISNAECIITGARKIDCTLATDDKFITISCYKEEGRCIVIHSISK